MKRSEGASRCMSCVRVEKIGANKLIEKTNRCVFFLDLEQDREMVKAGGCGRVQPY